MDKDGWIVVFDLDDTIFLHEKNNISPHALQVLKKAVNNKGNTVAGIFLLTNNSDRIFIDEVIQILEKDIGKPVFDYVMTAEAKFKNIRDSDGPTLNYAKKRLVDVEYICKKLNLSTENLIQRILFFDDNPHEIMKEMERAGVLSNYALVNTINSSEWNKGDKLDTLPFQKGGKRKSKKYKSRKQIYKKKIYTRKCG